MITATSLKSAVVTGTQLGPKIGVAFLGILGSYTGTTTKDYAVEIDGTVDGTLLSSTFRWSDSAGATWNAQLVGPIVPLIPFVLNNGLSVYFVPQSTSTGQVQVAIGDRWAWKAIRPYGVNFLIDLVRNTEYRSATLTQGNTYDLTLDLGSAQTPTMLIIGDHNILSATTVRLQGSDVSNFGAPLEYDQAVTFQAGTMVHILTSPPNVRYWRIRITAGAGQTDWRVAEIYLGTSLIMGRQVRIGLTSGLDPVVSGNRESLLYGPGWYQGDVEHWEITFPAIQTGANLDVQRLRTLWTLTHDLPMRTQWPFFVLKDDADVSQVYLMHWSEQLREEHLFLDRWDVPLTLFGLLRSAA